MEQKCDRIFLPSTWHSQVGEYEKKIIDIPLEYLTNFPTTVAKHFIFRRIQYRFLTTNMPVSTCPLSICCLTTNLKKYSQLLEQSSITSVAYALIEWHMNILSEILKSTTWCHSKLCLCKYDIVNFVIVYEVILGSWVVCYKVTISWMPLTLVFWL